MPSTAILIPTCDRYRDICNTGIAWLQAYWKNHPPIYVCGVCEFPGQNTLTFTVHSRNWIGIAYEAVTQLENEGVDYLYLILDDHPPVAKCNETFLNEDLPKKAYDLCATWISLAGWDQFRPAKGVVLDSEDLEMMHNAEDYAWNMNLHPGLWNLSVMKRLLAELIKQYPDGGSARDFESIVKTIQYPKLESDRKALFRISGDYSACGDRWFKRKLNRRIIRYLIHMIRFSAKTASPSLLDKTDAYLKPYTEYLNGAYPMIWSGLMQNGEANETAHRFMKLSCNDSYLKSITNINNFS